MQFDTDRYYTPEAVALRVLELSALSSSPTACVDSTCGNGQLLEAASKVYGATECIGLDNDRKAIDQLRRKRPKWILSVGNLLNPKSYNSSLVSRRSGRSDLLILNPPFSQHNKKAVDILFDGHQLKGSVAMAHLLRSFELFEPRQGAIAIVPESLLYSEIDAFARKLLCDRYAIRKITDLDAMTFRGARAHATAVHFEVARSEKRVRNWVYYDSAVGVEAVRGALPVHLAGVGQVGVPFVHSTHIRQLTNASFHALLRTRALAKGRLSGWAVLIPRVGVPNPKSVKPLLISQTIQLSDCVIGLKCRNKKDARQVAIRIKERIKYFLKSYRGTGARYITLSRLGTALSRLNIRSTVKHRTRTTQTLRTTASPSV